MAKSPSSTRRSSRRTSIKRRSFRINTSSYFNNFNHNTDTSEILRFIAGLLKDQAPDVQPNTKTFSSVAIDDEANTGRTVPNVGFIPLGYQTGVTNATYDYLNSKGFAEPGKAIFHSV